MTEPTRGVRARRGNRRPGSLLLTALLVLAIVSSSALVFTDKVALLKLAVIVALWAAVVGAFVSFIYRRQADLDQAKSRDLKLVYDLQLDREISARREYELSVEAQLRRELASELQAHTSDEVASLRAELAALRANLEIIFDTDLQSRPALENERTTVHRFGDWDAAPPATPDRDDRGFGPGRVISSRIDTEEDDQPADVGASYDSDPNTEESPIIDVPAEPQPDGDEWAPPDAGGAHRRASEQRRADAGWRPPPPADEPQPETRLPWMPVEPPPPPPREPANAGWRPAPAQGQFIPAGVPGSNWASPVTGDDVTVSQPPETVTPPPPAQTPPPPQTPPPAQTPPPPPMMTPPPTEAPRPGRHYTVETAAESARRARHAAAAEDADQNRRTPPTLAPAAPPPPEAPDAPAPRHRGNDDAEEPVGQHIGGQPVSELMARLQANSTGGGRRRRREE
ncbi:hypothetical protein H7K45_17150 [Mycobacterium yunnanensis]|uniref:DUF6779 domain-containing protein n=1 Tax=Mycobacterium yunnanensis TaxID=368477 RepID=A0A9X2YMS2_9MYCO|nr:DUF6779 domain-containing protein [Mycobacterium yunnanensis]MCV7422277.1 hypothetical protein [Mycobacterium yunnanensis]